MQLREPSQWQHDTRYSKYDIVKYGDSTYFCIKSCKGIRPDTNPSYWGDDSTFWFDPTNGTSITETPLVIKTDFGDGYSQRSTFGPNNNFIKNLDLKFEHTSDKECQAILYFLHIKGGYQSFSYTPPAPYDIERQFICRKYEHSISYHNDNTVTAIFEEYYQYSPEGLGYTVAEKDYSTPRRLYAENAYTRKIESFELVNWVFFNATAIKNAPLLSYPFFPKPQIYAPLNNFGIWDGGYLRLDLYPSWAGKDWTQGVQASVASIEHPSTGQYEYRNYILDGFQYPILVKKDSIRDESNNHSKMFILDREKWTPQLFPFRGPTALADIWEYQPNGGGNNNFYVGWTHQGCQMPMDMALRSWWMLKSADFSHAMHDDVGGASTIWTPQAPSLVPSQNNRIFPETGAVWERFYDNYGPGNESYDDPTSSEPLYSPDLFDYTCQTLMWSWMNENLGDPILAKDWNGTEDEAKYALGLRTRYQFVQRPGFNLDISNGVWTSFTCGICADKNLMINPNVFHYGIDPTTFFSFSLGGGLNPTTNNKDWMTFGQALVGCGRAIPGGCYNPAWWAPISNNDKLYFSVTRCCGYYTSQLLPDEAYATLEYYTK